MSTTATNQKTARRRRTFSGRDKVTLGFFIGIPTFLHVALVWFPAVATIFLSFTYWTGIHISDIQWAGTANYENIFFNTVGEAVAAYRATHAVAWTDWEDRKA